MARFMRYVTAADKSDLVSALTGIPHRVRVIDHGLRVVLTGDFDRQSVADILNSAGFLAAGGAPFRSINIDGNGQFFVRHKTT